MNPFSKAASTFESHMSAAEWTWRIVGFFVVLAGGTTTAMVARGTELFGRAGALGWIAIGLGAALVIAIIIILVATAGTRAAEADYTRSMARDHGVTNPLSESFVNSVIALEDLRLPGRQLHSNKQFKRCSFVGPGAIALMGGTYQFDSFIGCGDFIPLPEGVVLTGVVVLQNCTVESCEFHRITILAAPSMIAALLSSTTHPPKPAA
jgi:hypothetical protein